jgi:hypothetical protein
MVPIEIIYSDMSEQNLFELGIQSSPENNFKIPTKPIRSIATKG